MRGPYAALSATVAAEALISEAVAHSGDALQSYNDGAATTSYRINSLVSLHCLPPEIFATILHAAVEDTGKDRVDRLHAMAMVSRVWRDTALQTPRLWSYIHDDMDGKSLAWSLQRSRTAPLNLKIGSWGFTHRMMDSVVREAERWSSLRLNVGYLSSQFEAVKGGLAGPTPWLTHLEIHISTPRTVELGPGCHLKYLSFTRVAVSWDSPRLANLVALTLHDTPQTPTFHQLAAVMAASPGLEYLDLADLPIEHPHIGGSSGELQPDFAFGHLVELRLKALPVFFLAFCLKAVNFASERLSKVDISTWHDSDGPALCSDPAIGGFAAWLKSGMQNSVRMKLVIENYEFTASASWPRLLARTGNNTKIGYQELRYTIGGGNYTITAPTLQEIGPLFSLGFSPFEVVLNISSVSILQATIDNAVNACPSASVRSVKMVPSGPYQRTTFMNTLARRDSGISSWRWPGLRFLKLEGPVPNYLEIAEWVQAVKDRWTPIEPGEHPTDMANTVVEVWAMGNPWYLEEPLVIARWEQTG